MACVMLPHAAMASVLGSAALSLRSYEISDGTVLYENKFMSDQKGVGQQSEYYAEYTPNTSTVPVVVTGDSIYGKRTAQQAADYMKKNGMRPMVGINASYFSFQTGVPMGHVISEGRVMSKDSSTLQSIGFLANGEAFIAPLAINTTLKTENGDAGIANVNKYNVASLPGISMYNSDFGADTKNNVESLSVILDVGEGELGIGKTINATVSDKFVYTGALAIEKGKIILSINIDGNYEYHYNILNALNVGDSVSIECSAEGDERWAQVQNGLGSEGETLIQNGQIGSGFPKGAAPRTAVGITENGNVLFYVLDGRNTGHSYGAQITTIAKRLLELGCVDAINLDGGGSTSISGVYPGADDIAVLDVPSEGKLRAVTNFIFLKNVNERTGVLKSIYTTPQQQSYLSGAQAELSSIGLDTAYYKTDAGAVSYTADGESSVSGNVVTFRGNGTVNITSQSGDVATVSKHYVYDMPDDIVLSSGGKRIDSLTLQNGQSAVIGAEAYVGYNKLIAQPESFSYSVEGGIGTIDETGRFTAASDSTREGRIVVTGGKKAVSVPVKVVNDDYVFSDVTSHWAREMIRAMAKGGVINGYETADGLAFLPDNSITRAEFAVMLAGYLKLDTAAYSDSAAVFDDEIPAWAKNAAGAMYELGYISGKQDGSKICFAANDKITRAEAAAMIGRTQQQLTEEAQLGFSDSDSLPQWAKTYTARLVAAGIISGYEDNTLKPNNRVTRAEAAVMLYKLANM